MKQYNEQDVLKAIAGSYQPGFLQIKLTHSFDGGLGRFSQKELGTFLHEYVHFLQNISTPWGLYMSMVSVSAMLVSIHQKNIAQAFILERYFFVSICPAAIPDTCLSVFLAAVLLLC